MKDQIELLMKLNLSESLSKAFLSSTINDFVRYAVNDGSISASDLYRLFGDYVNKNLGK